MSLRRFDLNLLTIFDVLIEERNITRSAARLSMSQPAVSHALARLRQQLDDPILVRAGESMQPSPRALEIHREIQDALKTIEHTLKPQKDFDPAKSERRFSIATTDYVEALILPALLSRLQQQAPGIELHIRHLSTQLPLKDIEEGLIDMAIGRGENIPKRFKSRKLLDDDYLCAISNKHELAGKKLTFNRYLEMEHLLVAPNRSRRDMAKQLFRTSVRQPKIIANMQHFISTLHAASESDLIVTGPKRLLQKFEKPFELYLMKIPFELEPFHIDMVWHQFKAADQGLAWLREQLYEIAIELTEDAPV